MLTEMQLLQDMQKIMGAENECVIDGNAVYFPKWDMRIRAAQADGNPQMAMLNFNLTCPRWDREVFECSVGIGENAMGLAQGGFYFGIMDGLRVMMDRKEALDRAETEFMGNKHRWTVYHSNIIGLGETPKDVDTRHYWNLLREDLLDRLGNQKINYVKVYCAKNGDQITGECRINDVKSEDLSRKLAKHLETWDTKDFGSHKQFFFMEQDEDTYIPYPHTEAEIAAHTRKAIELFTVACKDPGFYDTFPDKLTAAIGDRHLAWELHCFLPELCAENAFQEVEYHDTLLLRIAEKDISCFKNQLASYNPIHRALNAAFGTLIDRDTYGAYISVSATWSVIQSAKSRGQEVTGPKNQMAICYMMEDGYKVR